MEDLHRINLKFFLRDPHSLDPETAFGIFSDWIPQTTDELLIDVADYSHVPSGPVTLLVGHEANYCINDGEGRRGLLYARKQSLSGPLKTRLQTALRAALAACRRIEEEPVLAGKVAFAGNEFLLLVNDRLNAPNDRATHDALAPEIASLASRIFGDSNLTVERDEAPEKRFNLRLKTAVDLDVATLLHNLSN